MKAPTKKELQEQHAKAIRHNEALKIAVCELSIIAAAPASVVHPTYRDGALKTLKKIQDLVLPRK